MKTVKKYLSLALILTLALTFLSANSLIQPVYAAGSTGPNGEFIPPGYELATDADFTYIRQSTQMIDLIDSTMWELNPTW